MFPSRHSRRYSSQQFTRKSKSSLTQASSRPQQTQLGGSVGYSSRTTYLQDTFEHESLMGQLLSPPSPPPSLEQILSAEPANSSSQRLIPASSSNSRYPSLYDDIERELFAKPSGSSSQLDGGAISISNANSGGQILCDVSAQVSTAPDSSRHRRQSAGESTSRRAQESYSHHTGVRIKKDKWVSEWRDPSQGSRRVWIGTFATQNEAISALETYKASRGFSHLTISCHPGIFKQGGWWVASYGIEGRQVYVGSYRTVEEAEKALHEHRAARGLPPVIARRKR